MTFLSPALFRLVLHRSQMHVGSLSRLLYLVALYLGMAALPHFNACESVLEYLVICKNSSAIVMNEDAMLRVERNSGELHIRIASFGYFHA